MQQCLNPFVPIDIHAAENGELVCWFCGMGAGLTNDRMDAYEYKNKPICRNCLDLNSYIEIQFHVSLDIKTRGFEIQLKLF